MDTEPKPRQFLRVRSGATAQFENAIRMGGVPPNEVAHVLGFGPIILVSVQQVVVLGIPVEHTHTNSFLTWFTTRSICSLLRATPLGR